MELGKRWWLLLVGAVPFLLAVAMHWGSGPAPQAADHAQYLLHAQQLADGGSYADIGFIWTRWSAYIPAAYPPGLPLTLWPVLELVGPDKTAIAVLMLAFTLAFILFAGARFARENLLLGVGVAGMLSLSGVLVHQAPHPMSDLPFCALVWAAIFVIDRPGRWSVARIVTVTGLTAAALLYRAAGAALIPALLLYAALQYRRLGLRPAIPGALLLMLIGAGALVFPIGGLSSQVPSLSVARLLGMVGRLADYKLAFLQSHLYPFPSNVANDAFHLVSVGLMLIGLAVFAYRTRVQFVTVFAVSYLAMLLVVPVEGGERYMWPISPVLIFGFLYGVSVVAGRINRFSRPGQAERVALTVAALVGLGEMVRHPTEAHEPSFAERADVEDIFRYFGERQLTEEPRAAFVRPRILRWESGTPAMALFAAPPDTTVAEFCRAEISHVVLGTLGWAPRVDSAMQRVVQELPRRFELEHRNQSFAVYRFRREECPERAPAVPNTDAAAGHAVPGV